MLSLEFPDGTRINGSGLRHLGSLSRLRFLHLGNTGVAESALKYFAGREALHVLTGIPPEVVKAWLAPVAEGGVPWADSEDGTLSLRLFAETSVIETAQPITLIAELRNNSQRAVNVLRPFGDWYVALVTGVELHGPDGVLRYTGPAATYEIDSRAFARLAPGDSVRDRLELQVRYYAGGNEVGQYRVVFIYAPTEHHGVTAAAMRPRLKDLWLGRIRSHGVNVKRH